MEFHQVKNTDDSLYSTAWSLYEASFPEDERRNLAQQKDIFKKKEYSFFAIVEKNTFLGFLSTWNLDTFIFIEHFAVKEELRGKGIGTKILLNFIQELKNGKDIVLETELPHANPAAKKRALFYERLGFKLCLENYIQPAYHANKKPVPLYLMRYGKEISKKEFEHIKEKLYDVVYEAAHV